MTNQVLRIRTVLATLTVLMVAACGSTEPLLESKPAAAPSDVDLSGQWQLRDRRNARSRPKADDQIILPTRSARRQQARRGRSQGSPVSIFLEHGSDVKISQTAYSMFISYDRAIVEEYTFGENRLINVGPIEARRVSGWDGASFVVETLDREGATLFETWSLQSTEVLKRDVRIVKDDEEVFALQQLFDRS